MLFVVPKNTLALFPVYPPQDSVIDRFLLTVLCLGEAHAVLLLVTILVGEDNHEVLAREILLQLVRQPLKGVLVGDGTLTGGDDDKQMVVGDVGGQLRQLVPMAHRRKFGTHGVMAVVDILADERQRLLTPMELDAAV